MDTLENELVQRLDLVIRFAKPSPFNMIKTELCCKEQEYL